MNLSTLRSQLAALIHGSVFAGKAYFAGGCVRDYIQLQTSGIPQPESNLHDIDITVEMPHGGILLAEYLQPHFPTNTLKCFPEFGTAKLTIADTCIEFVATRKEHYHRNNRFPTVSPGTLLDDVQRRDFTINSLLMDITTGEILDLTRMGISDLNNGIVRCIGKPIEKFREDSLRLLRALRFALSFGYSIEPVTYVAMQSEAIGINRLSQASIKLELDKIALHTSSQALQQAISKLGWNSPKLHKLLRDIR